MVVGIDPSHVPDEAGQTQLLEDVKGAVSALSQALFVATGNRAALGEVTIVVPKNWIQPPDAQRATIE